MPASILHPGTASRVCFGYRTALQIQRAAHPKTLSPTRARTATPPDHAPGKREVEAAIAQVEAIYPGLRIERPVHVLVGGASRCRTSETCESHVCSVSLAGTSFYQIGDGIGISAPALAFIHEAACGKSAIPLLELGYELCGSYRSKLTGASSAYQVAPLASVRGLADYVSRNPSVHGARKIARLIPYLADNSASPRETKQALVFGLPHRHGGYGLGIARMNYPVRASRAAQASTGKRFFRGDLCWVEDKLDVEYQSRECHEGEANRLSDSRRANALMSMGWTVIGVTNDELDSLAATDTIAQSIRRHLGKHSQVRVSYYHARKLKLRRQLGLPIGYE